MSKRDKRLLAAGLSASYVPESEYDHALTCLDVLADATDEVVYDSFYHVDTSQAYRDLRRIIERCADRTRVPDGFQVDYEWGVDDD